MPDLEALKSKVLAPSVKQALKAKNAVKQYQAEKELVEEEDKSIREKQNQEAVEAKKRKVEQAKGDRSGIKVSGCCLYVGSVRLTSSPSARSLTFHFCT